MPATDRSISVLRLAAMAAPLLLVLNGCAAAPVMELAASGPGGGGLMGTMQKFMPGTAAAPATPCTPGATNASAGCNAGVSGNARRGQAAGSSAPAWGTQAKQAAPCAAGGTNTQAAGCDSGGLGGVVQGLAGSLQKFAPGSLFSH